MNNRYLAVMIGIALAVSVPFMLSQPTQSQVDTSVFGIFQFNDPSVISVLKADYSKPKLIVESPNVPLKQPIFIDGLDHPVLYFYLSAETKADAEFKGIPRTITVSLEVSVDNGVSWKSIGQATGVVTNGVWVRDGTGGFASPVYDKAEVKQIKFRIIAVGNGEVRNVQAFVIPLVSSTWV